MSGRQSLRIRVTRSATDYWAAILVVFWARASWGWIAVVALIASGATFEMGLAKQSATVLTDSLFVGLSAAAICAVTSAIILRMTASRASRLPGALEPIVYTFSEDGLAVESAIGRSETIWRAWKRAIETRSLFVLISMSGVAQVFPKRNLSADEQMRVRILFDQFVNRTGQVFVEHKA